MFEKEAEERAKDYTDNARRQVAYECGFLDGVDFLYNKNKKELAEAKDIIEDLITKIPASLVAHFESEKERAEKFLGWK